MLKTFPYLKNIDVPLQYESDQEQEGAISDDIIEVIPEEEIEEDESSQRTHL